MNKLYVLLFSVAVLGSLTSCKEEVEVVTPDKPGTEQPAPLPTEPTGAITPVATPEGAIVSATIGPAGGSIESADKRIQVNIPAGALTTSQTISLQPLNRNHCPQGTGQAFRLLPHGLTFAKPATLTMQYNQQDVEGSAPQLLRIAYQTDQGHWQSPGTKSIDTTARTLSVQTTHFSDWGLFQTMVISPDQAFLNPGEEVELNVLVVPVKDYGDELLVPIPYPAPAKYIKDWVLRGESILVSSGNQGAYYAPKKIPVVNPEAVTVYLNQSVTIGGQEFKDLRLVANFFVAPEGISIQVGKDEWKTFPGGANIGSGWSVVAGEIGNEHIQLGWTGTPTGTYHWTAGPGVSFLYVNGLFHRSHMYFKEVSGGVLRVNTEHPEWVTGTFTLTRAGWIDASSAPPAHGTSAITGVFRVKRV